MVAVSYVNFTTTRRFHAAVIVNPGPLNCDSVSFAGTRDRDPDESVVAIDNVNGTILIYCMTINAPILGPGFGPVAKLFFTVDPAAAAQMVPIDTVFILPTGQFEFTDQNGAAKKTEFFAGGIDISTTPCFEFPTDTVAFIMDIGGIVPSISFPVTNPCGVSSNGQSRLRMTGRLSRQCRERRMMKSRSWLTPRAWRPGRTSPRRRSNPTELGRHTPSS